MFQSKLRHFGCLILLLALIPVFFTTACAEMEEFEYYAGDPIPPNSSDIINFKGKLFEQGFYISGADNTVLHSLTLDAETMAAVQLVCNLNPDLNYYPDGVTRILYWRVMGMYGDPIKTPLDEVYKLLPPGVEDDAVSKVQTRLSRLNYGEEAGFHFTAGVYDEELQQAIDAFVEINDFFYNREDGITVELQEMLFSDDARENDGSSKQGLSQRLFSYISGSSAVFGFRMPNAVVLILIFLLVCVIAVLILKLFSPVKPRETHAASRIELEIAYGGTKCQYIGDLNDAVRIGRSISDFPINPNDKSVSRNHCEICLDRQRVVLKDHSRFGTSINGVLIHDTLEELHPGDVIGIGEHRIKIQSIMI